jgi:hypothetical protein
MQLVDLTDMSKNVPMLLRQNLEHQWNCTNVTDYGMTKGKKQTVFLLAFWTRMM